MTNEPEYKSIHVDELAQWIAKGWGHVATYKNAALIKNPYKRFY